MESPTADIPSQPSGFLDVPMLLELSRPRQRVSWVGYGIGLVLFLVLMGAYAGGSSSQAAEAIEVLSSLVMVLVVVGMSTMTWYAVRAQRAEQTYLESAEELIQLRRWPEAAMLLQGLLSRPMRTHGMRAQALIFLTSVLARYHRFEDAIAVQNHLLDELPPDSSTAYAVKLGRAMAMLRDDHLYDADRAISELRRSQDASDSAGLALVEIYRDVKTGHPTEAVELFNAKRSLLRQQLGHRIADAYALLAKAYDLLGRTEQAGDAYAAATTLSPAPELHRRYPELAGLIGRYQPAPAPAEVA